MRYYFCARADKTLHLLCTRKLRRVTLTVRARWLIKLECIYYNFPLLGALLLRVCFKNELTRFFLSSLLSRWVFLSLRCEAIEFISLYTFMVSFIPASLRHTEQNLYYFILVIKIDVGSFFLNKWKKWFVYLMKNFSVFGCKQTNSNRRTCIIIIIKRHVRRISNWNVRGAQPWRGIPDAAAVESRSRVAKLVFCQVFYFYIFSFLACPEY